MIIWHSSVHFRVSELGECFVLHNKIGFIGHVVSRLMSSRFLKDRYYVGLLAFIVTCLCFVNPSHDLNTV